MQDSKPSPDEARAALDEAARHAERLRTEDQRLRLVLVVIAVAYVTAGFLLGIPRLERPAVNPGLTLLGVIGGCIVVCVVLLRGMRAASKRGTTRYFSSIAAFGVWNVTVLTVSIASGWWRSGAPGYHFTVTTVVASVPLVVAAALMGSRRR
jgi:CDP-diglyceride synthetase